MIISLICLTLTLTSFSSDCGIESYFKKPADKSGKHSMRNIDFIYMINLDQRPEKFLSCTRQLDPYGISPYRFSAVNGWELTLADINQLGVIYEPWMLDNLWGTLYPEDGDGMPQHEVMQVVGRNYFSHCMSRGAIGITLSHLSVLQDAYDSGYETIWVMEDDIDIIQNPHHLSYLIDALNARVGCNGWDILFTDQDTKNNDGQYVPCFGYALKPNFNPPNPNRFYTRTTMDSNFIEIGARYGAYSMIVKRSGMKKILDFVKNYKIFLPYDMEFYLPYGIKMFTVLKDIVSTVPNSPSDNGAPAYLHKQNLIGTTK